MSSGPAKASKPKSHKADDSHSKPSKHSKSSKSSEVAVAPPAVEAVEEGKKSKKRKAEEEEEQEKPADAPAQDDRDLGVSVDSMKKSKVSDEPSSFSSDPDYQLDSALNGGQPGDYKFSSLNVSPDTLKAIDAMGFTRMTEVQARSIPIALTGVDILGAAKTGSGKTVAFLLPAIEMLIKVGFKARNGTGVLVISPTRELALQIYGVVRELSVHHTFTHGIVMGGTNRRAEADRLAKGVNLLVGTPGRLLDHLQHTSGFVFKNLAVLVVDEADRILEIGFEQELKEIIAKLPANRQTMMFSATQTQNVKAIARISLKGRPVYIGVDDKKEAATAEGLEQGYVICPSAQRFLLLFTFLKKNLKKKVIVFFSTCAATQYYAELLNYIDVPVLELHGQQKQNKRTTTFFEFCNADKGILLCTDVAARGLDIPSVDWIIQFDPPEDPKEYIHRVGRTARAGNSGRALLFLLPQELRFLKHLKHARIPLNEYEFPINKIAGVQEQLEKLVSKNYYLHKSAREAYRSYMQAYAQHTFKEVFDVHELNVLEVAKSFGFEAPPKVQLKISLKPNKKYQKAGHGFSEDNPYGGEEGKQPAKTWSR